MSRFKFLEPTGTTEDYNDFYESVRNIPTNDNWWTIDEDVQVYMNELENAPAPQRIYPKRTDDIPLDVLRLESFSLSLKCEQLRREFLMQLYEDRVKHHFIETQDGIKVITYLEQL